MVSASRVVGVSNIQQHYEFVMLARALRIQQGQRDFKKQSGSGEANGRLDCFVASAFPFAR